MTETPTRTGAPRRARPGVWDNIPQGAVSGQAKGTVEKVSDQFNPREEILLGTALQGEPLWLFLLD